MSATPMLAIPMSAISMSAIPLYPIAIRMPTSNPVAVWCSVVVSLCQPCQPRAGPLSPGTSARCTAGSFAPIRRTPRGGSSPWFWFCLFFSSFGRWFGLVWFGLVWFSLVWFSLVWFGLVWFGLVWFGLVWFGLVRFGLVWLGLASILPSLVWLGFEFV